MANGDDREAIWSVAKSTRRLYYAVFVAQYLLCIAFAAIRAATSGGDGFFDTWTTVWVQAGGLAIACAANSIILIELGRIPVVISEMLRERLERMRNERRAEGREKVLGYIKRELASARERGDDASVKLYEKTLQDLDAMESP